MKKWPMIGGALALILLLGFGLTRLDGPRDGEAAPEAAPPQPQAEPAPSKDAREETVDALLDGMDDEALAGQLFFARCPEGGEAELAATYGLGGYILFGRDFANRTPDTLREMVEGCQAVSKVPMLMGVDEEGGTVVRASAYPQYREQKFLSPQKLYRQGGLEAVGADAAEKAAFLKNLGLNVNLAPVCDVSTDPGDYMYKRAFGKDAAATAEYVRAVVTATREGGVGCVLKHFPGYGNNADTHTGSALDRRPLSTFLESDLLPFRAGAEAGAGCVLVSHNVIEAVDPDHPASLSGPVHELLRQEAGFTGVALTDDLVMEAVTDYAAPAEAAVTALAAGSDMVISSDVAVQLPAVVAALADGTLPRARVREAARRVLQWKYDLGLLTETQLP